MDMVLDQVTAIAAEDVAVCKSTCYVKQKGAFVRSEAPFVVIAFFPDWSFQQFYQNAYCYKMGTPGSLTALKLVTPAQGRKKFQLHLRSVVHLQGKQGRCPVDQHLCHLLHDHIS